MEQSVRASHPVRFGRNSMRPCRSKPDSLLPTRELQTQLHLNIISSKLFNILVTTQSELF